MELSFTVQAHALEEPINSRSLICSRRHSVQEFLFEYLLQLPSCPSSLLESHHAGPKITLSSLSTEPTPGLNRNSNLTVAVVTPAFGVQVRLFA